VDFWLTLAFSVLLLLAAAGLMVSHLRAWRQAQEAASETNAKEIDYRRRQLRRRVQSTAMLGGLAVALAVGNWITVGRVGPLVFAVYWGGVVLVVLWVTLLAAADIVSTKHHFGRIRDGQLIDKARLEAELRRIRSAGTNGKSPGGADVGAGKDES
jgi:sterol desaturase/sphingolipid hydroxylase (fatty acid hydroxylase superfamily)